MRAIWVMVLLVGCAADGAGEDGSDGADGSDRTDGKSEGSLFCCTLREFCLACGCSTAEVQIVESDVDAACKQLLDSNDYRCALSDETTALAKCVSDSPPAPSAASSSSSEPFVPDAEGLEAVRHAESAFCRFTQRCWPASWVESDVEACVSRAIHKYTSGFFGVPHHSEGAAACYDALADLPCAELDSRDTDPRDQLQWYRQQELKCSELMRYSCASRADCGDDWLCSSDGEQCGECRWAGNEEDCKDSADCQFGDTCVAGECTARISVEQPCSSTSQCVNGWCDGYGFCRPVSPLDTPCNVDDECGIGAWCSEAGCAVQGEIGDFCEGSSWSSCKLGLSCVDGQCAPWGPPGAALEGEYCSWEENCARGLTCYSYTCSRRSQESCRSDNQCAENEYCALLCDPAADCADQCRLTDDEVATCVDECGSDQTCVDECGDETACFEQCLQNLPDCGVRECQPKRPLGGACTRRTDCQSDACSDSHVCIERACD